LQNIFITDALTAEASFKSGAGEVIQCYTDQMANSLKKAGFKIITYPGFQYYLYPDGNNADSPGLI